MQVCMYVWIHLAIKAVFERTFARVCVYLRVCTCRYACIGKMCHACMHE